MHAELSSAERCQRKANGRRELLPFVAMQPGNLNDLFTIGLRFTVARAGEAHQLNSYAGTAVRLSLNPHHLGETAFGDQDPNLLADFAGGSLRERLPFLWESAG